MTDIGTTSNRAFFVVAVSPDMQLVSALFVLFRLSYDDLRPHANDSIRFRFESRAIDFYAIPKFLRIFSSTFHRLFSWISSLFLEGIEPFILELRSYFEFYDREESNRSE